MSDTFTQMRLKVLRNCRIPNNSSTPSNNAITDIGEYINHRAKSVWERRTFSEYIILGTYELPANTKVIALSSITVESGFGTAANGYGGTFALIGAVREGTNPIFPEDIGAVNQVDPSLWGQTLSPVKFIPRGANGIYLLGSYSVATTLSFWGKASFADLTASETWCLGESDALINGATADIYLNHWKDPNTAAAYEAKYENGIRLLVDKQEVQGGSRRRLIPSMNMGNSGSGISFQSKSGI
jgi:hypothetical protein